MKRDEAIEVVEQVLTRWPIGDWTEEQIAAYTSSVMTLPYELTMRALDVHIRESKFRPAISELLDIIRALRRSEPAPKEPDGDPTPQRGVPFWVRRWVAARWLYEKFGKAQDMRPFPEQADYANPDAKMMPADAWVEEGARVTDAEVLGHLGTGRVT